MADRTKRNAVPRFIAECLDVSLCSPAVLVKVPQKVRQWVRRMCNASTTALAASTSRVKRSRGRVEVIHARPTARRNRPGQGRPCSAPAVRDALFEWWISVRHGVDWNALAHQNNKKGHRCLCRFPKAVIVCKLRQLMVEYAAAAVLSGQRDKVFTPDAHWFRR